MAAMLIFTVVLNVIGWGIFTLTDLYLGSFSFVHMIVLAEWFIVPMAASAIYRKVTGAENFSDVSEKTIYMLMWFVMGAGVSGVICNAIDNGKWFAAHTFSRYDYLSYATAFVLGFIVYSIAYELVKFFVEGGYGRRIAKN